MANPQNAGQEDTLPEWFRHRWHHRRDQLPGQGMLYWHMLVGFPAVAGLAQLARQRLAPFSGFHLTPLQWLHITVLTGGPADQVTPGGLQQMIRTASGLLSDAEPATVSVGRLRYHPEGIMLAVEPASALAPIRDAVRAAAGVAADPGGEDDGMWRPHITLCYSTSRQPAEPVIAALGSALPAREVCINAVSLVIQHGPERRWDWEIAGTIRFGRRAPENRFDLPAEAETADAL